MISILCALKNGIEFLQTCVDSVNSQTFKRWELIIGLNGLEKDCHTEKEAIRICDNNKKIRVIRYDCKGKSETLNKMVEECNYNHIAILDVDDYWKNNKLEIQVGYIKRYNVVGTQCKYFGEKDLTPNIPLRNFTQEHDFLSFNPIINSSVIINKKDAYWDEKFEGIDDYHLWLELRYKKGRSFYNVPEVLTFHRIHNDSAYNHYNNELVDKLKENYAEYAV